MAVAETLNFRQATRACNITQPALSAQIQQLETRLGLKLFERDRRRVLATAAGTVLAEKARGLLAELRELADAASTFTELLSGTIRLGVIPTVAPYVLPRATRPALSLPQPLFLVGAHAPRVRDRRPDL
ncbi:MAG: LysR family hydrogen peroxide-inducible transcriptional activator [Chlamydiales bacterium]